MKGTHPRPSVWENVFSFELNAFTRPPARRSTNELVPFHSSNGFNCFTSSCRVASSSSFCVLHILSNIHDTPFDLRRAATMQSNWFRRRNSAENENGLNYNIVSQQYILPSFMPIKSSFSRPLCAILFITALRLFFYHFELWRRLFRADITTMDTNNERTIPQCV